ncbi:hypothetical protein AEAC466_04375 [Asticcacaulis sp. AC466]|uniref:DUF7220 family protein n=1 Tax=Asticcacaulis sp. AC466 TaxID=1282362 RepID=UPI0003C3D2FC|nr:hypothetical protein [Asticcacaulis sp. AC466]ESQ85382.1 hypothetical protein AEAC466_04375 [Asticcacaulis sp. AC466]
MSNPFLQRCHQTGGPCVFPESCTRNACKSGSIPHYNPQSEIDAYNRSDIEVTEKLYRHQAAAARQSRIDSFMEAITNTAVGFTISLCVQLIVAHIYHLPISIGDNLVIVGIFTVVSIIRQYVVRRLFDGKSVWQAIKARFVR